MSYRVGVTRYRVGVIEGEKRQLQARNAPEMNSDMACHMPYIPLKSRPLFYHKFVFLPGDFPVKAQFQKHRPVRRIT